MRVAILFLICTTLLAACRRERVTDSKTALERFSTQVADAKQAQLWKQVADGPQRDLSQFTVSEKSVQTRHKMAAADKPARPPAPVQTKLPGEQPNGVRILAAPDLADAAFAGDATVKSIEGERVELDLGEGRGMSLLVRVQTGGLPARPGEKVRVEWRSRPVPENRMEILALLTASGHGIVTVLDGAAKPVNVEVPLFRLSAAQTGTPEKGSMPVEVRVGEERQILRPGQIAEFKSARLAVGIVASRAITGKGVESEEGNPYALRLLAWPVQ